MLMMVSLMTIQTELDDEKLNYMVNLEVNENIFEEIQKEFALQKQNDPNISPVYNPTTVYNTTESTTNAIEFLESINLKKQVFLYL